MEAKKCEPVQF